MFHRNAVSQQKFDASPSSDAAAQTQSNNSDNQTKDQPAMNAQDNKADNEAQKNEGAQARVDIPGAGGFQRPGQPPVANRAPGAYPGSYPGSYAPSPASAGAGAGLATDANRKLVIGQGITLSGEIESCDYLIVEGTVEAALKGASRMDITENGAFFGTVEIDEATIAGRFEGDLTVKGRLTIRATGTIIGSVAYKELAVEAGATLDGKVNPLDGSKAQSSNKKFAKQNNKPQDNSAELPFGQKASA